MKKLIFISIFFFIALQSNSQNNCVGTAGQITWSYWLGFTSTPDSADLFALETFPSLPTGKRVLGTTQSPVNFDEYYASMMRGYIKVPTTGNYFFNITSDDKGTFYLSTNDLPQNKTRRAEVKTYTNPGQHDKETNQTSAMVTLVAGQYYYFEVHGFEGGGGDHVNLYWRRDTETTWRIIDYTYLYDYACGQTCPARGTACNDGNATTTNDQEDGFCNCVGIMPTANACVGDKALVEAYYYDNVSGSYIEPDLINSPKFPLLPDRKERLQGAYGPLVPYTKDNYGSLVQGFITVPVTGIYEFLITGDDNTYFFMSKNDSIEYKQYHQALVIWGIDENNYTNSTFQRIAPLTLEKGKYYYYEFRHKESGWRDHFNLFWKTPFHEQKTWKRVTNFYLHDYKCEISCIPQGTLCNDGNPFTNNDQYNATCQCVGTPCTGPDCDDAAARYQKYEICAPTKSLTTTEESSWVSCSTTANPNPARAGMGHWIRYDFGNQYKLQATRVWNYNVAGQTDKGFKTVYVDYSLDGTNWTSLGSLYTWNQAPGTPDYGGFLGPNFNDLKARYVLISAADNWGGPCSGFSKITFDGIQCDPADTPCDDEDPLTKYDKFDASCNCKGVDIQCASDTLKLDRMTLADGTFQAKKRVESLSLVPTTKNITFTAGNNIVLLPGFEVNNNAVFTAKIEDCIRAAFMENQPKPTAAITSQLGAYDATKTVSGFGAEAENPQIKRVIFRLNQPAQVKLVLN
jgi:hypothetical protein